MATQKKSVPKFTSLQIKIADLCARELWRGYKYTSDAITDSDEILMNILHTPFYKLKRKLSITYKLSHVELDQFIRAADLRRLVDFGNVNRQKGLDSIRLDIAKKYRKWLKLKNKDFANEPADAVKKLGQEFFKKSKARKSGNHIALASRVLFFAIPEMTFFNYSNAIAKELGLSTANPSNIIHDYHRALEKGLDLNWDELTKYDMPFSHIELPDELWETARNNGWWQRRVFDLALLTALCKKEPKLFIQTIAANPVKKHP
jgi:hypothetical protein